MPSELFGRALAAHQLGQLKEAETAYRQVLLTDPSDAAALHLLGVLLHQTGRSDLAVQPLRRATEVRRPFPEACSDLAVVLTSLDRLEEAAASCREALRQRPDYPEAHLNLGNILRDRGDISEAEASFREAAQLRPGYAEAHYNLGNLFYAQGRTAEAETSYREALRLQPGNAQAEYNLGSLLHDLRRLDEAESSFARAVALQPAFADAHHNHAIVLRDLGRFADAERSCRAALRLQPDRAEYHQLLGGVLHELDRLPEAEASFHAALRARPDFAAAHNSLGNVLRDLDRPAEAEACYREALRLAPHNAEALNNLGIVLDHFGQAAEAEAAYRDLLRERPDFVPAYCNLGRLLTDEARLTEAEASYRQALRLDPAYPEAHQDLGLTLLLAGRFEEGWEEYEWRWKTKQLARFRRNFDVPQWNGEPLAGRTILLHAEQGLGDTLQFCRYAPLVAAHGGRVVLEVQPRLPRLIRTLPGIAEILGQGQRLPGFDLHCPLMSLPRAFQTTQQTIPGETPYLRAEPALVQRWRQRLVDRETKADSIKIGVVWRGSAANSRDSRRSLSATSLAPLSAIPDVRLISLQKGNGSDELDALPIGMAIERLGDDFDTGPDAFVDTAAVMMCLDLIISADTSVVHLAGALGRPVWLLNRYVPDWRWQLGQDDSPWYPTLRQFRQERPGDWNAPILAIRDELQKPGRGLAGPPI